MSIRWSELEPETRGSIEAQPLDLSQSAGLRQRTCGCDISPDAARVRLCQYHQGFEEGVIVKENS